MNPSKVRDPFWDTLKLVLIFLVIYGHAVLEYAPVGSFNYSMYCWIYMFHMPLFFFISGRFSQLGGNNYWSRILKLFETYVVFQVVVLFWTVLLEGKTLNINLVKHFVIIPKWHLWYLFSLITMKMLAYLPSRGFIERNPISIISISIIISLFGGFLPVSLQFSLQRTMAFLPFFVLGMYSVRIDFSKFLNIIPNYFAITVLMSFFFILHLSLKENINFMIHGYYNYYSSNDYCPFTLFGARFFYLLIAALMGLLVMRIVPTNTQLSKLGGVTLFVYIYHSFVIKLLRIGVKFDYIPSSEVLLFLYSVLIMLILCCVSRIQIFNVLLNPISYYFNQKKNG